MQALRICLFILLGHFVVHADPLVRVRLFEKYDRLIISGEIVVKADRPLEGRQLVIENQGFNYTWSLEQASGTLIGLEDFSSPLNVSGKGLTYNKLKLPENLRIVPVRQNNGKFSRFIVLGILELENYLAGVLPHEMPLGWPLEALKAQLVTARTYTLKQIENRREDFYDVDSTVRDQLFVYDFPFSEERRKNLNMALEATRGLVLTNEQGKVAMAHYHADCGGQTELPKNVWNFASKGVAVNDSACALRPQSQWSFAISADELLKKIRGELEVSPLLQMTSLVPLSLTSSGRVNVLALKFSDGSQRQIQATRLREILGYSSLKSTRFESKFLNGQILFFGRGFGHGVGFCQWGAKDLARAGRNFKEILLHYFPNYQIRRLQ